MKTGIIELVLISSVICCTCAQTRMKLFTGYDDSTDMSQENLPYLKVRSVNMNPELMDVKNFNPGDKIVIDLFNDIPYISTIDRINVNINGTISIRTRFDEYNHGFLILSITDTLYLGYISIPHKNEIYSLKTCTTSGKTYLKLLDPSKLDDIEGGPPIISPE